MPTRPLTLLNAQRAMLTSIEITGGPSNRVAEMTGAVGHIVGVGARAPPLSWEAELSELLASDFAVAHRRAMERRRTSPRSYWRWYWGGGGSNARRV